MDSGAGAILALFILILYFLPSIIAHSRKAAIRGTATVINFFLGWTLIGWVVALALAFGSTEKPKPSEPAVAVATPPSSNRPPLFSGRQPPTTSPRLSISDFLLVDWFQRRDRRILVAIILLVLGVWVFNRALTIIGPRFWLISVAAVTLVIIWTRGPWERTRKMQIFATTAITAIAFLMGWTGWLYVSEVREASALMRQAQVAEKSGDYAYAHKLYGRLLELRQDPRARVAKARISSLAESQTAYQQGLQLSERGQTENSIAAFKRVAPGTPWYEDAQSKISTLGYMKGQRSLQAGQFKDAIQGYKGVAQTSPMYPKAQEGIRTAKARLTARYAGKLYEAEKALADGYRPARDPSRTRWGRVAHARDALAEVDVSYLTPEQQKRYYRLNAEVNRRESAIAEMAERVTKRYLREKFAEEAEKIFLDSGMDVTVSVEGRHKNVMRLKWVLWSRPLVYKWGKNTELIGKLRELGFTRVIFDTGFGERWWYDL